MFAGSQDADALPYESVATFIVGLSSGDCCELVITNVREVRLLYEVTMRPLQFAPKEKLHWLGAAELGTPMK